MSDDSGLERRSTSLFGDQEVALVDLLDRLLAGVVAAWADHPRVRVELTGPWVPYSFAGLEGAS